jgi:hypothetical protein
VSGDDSAYLGQMLHTNKKELGDYLDSIRANTALMKKELASALGAATPNALEATASSDDKTVYVAIAPTKAYIGGSTAEEAMKFAYQALLAEMRTLSLVGRPSFGFNLTNLGECLTTIRITPGIEEADLIKAYAEGIAAVGKELMKTPREAPKKQAVVAPVNPVVASSNPVVASSNPVTVSSDKPVVIETDKK